MSELNDLLFGNAEWLRRRERFYETALGPMRQPAVYHFDDDHDPHIDVYVIGRTATRAHETLVTGGMADRPMPGVPAGNGVPRRVELILPMPRALDWAALILREIASLPFVERMRLEDGVLIPGSRTITDGSDLRHALVTESHDPNLNDFIVEGEAVRFLQPVFLTEEEYTEGMEGRLSSIRPRLEEAGAFGALDVRRRSVV